MSVYTALLSKNIAKISRAAPLNAWQAHTSQTIAVTQHAEGLV